MHRSTLAAALVFGSVGIDLLMAHPTTWADAATVAVIGVVSSALVVGVTAWWPWIGAGGLVGVHVATGLRFGPLVNEGLRSWSGAGVVLAAAVTTVLAGWAVKEFPRGCTAIAASLGLTASVATALALGGAATPDGVGAHPDIVLITLDTVRRDRLSPYGGPVPMPALDRIAARGLVFDDAVATAPQTGPSHLSLLTGRLPARLGVVSNGAVIGDHPEILARVLRGRGWRTGGFVSGFPISARFGFDQGFDRYDSDFGARGSADRTWGMRLFDLVFTGTPRERRGDATIGRALAWVEQGTGPLFLWVHLYDPHAPYAAPAPWSDRFVTAPPGPRARDDLPGWWTERAGDDAWWRAQYDGELAWTDHLVDTLLSGLDARRAGVARIVAIVADHGESLGEHGVLFDHGDDLYDPAMRVPWILAGPGVSPGRIACQVSTVDLAPTVLDLAGVPETFPRDGKTLVPGFSGCASRDAWMSTVAARTANPPVAHGLRRPDHKCIAIDGRAVRFDLLADPGETAALPGDCDALLSFAAAATAPAPRADDAVTQQALERLGYVER